MSWYTDLLSKKEAARRQQEEWWLQNKATPEQIAEIEACPPMRQEAAQKYDLSPRRLTSVIAEKIIQKWRR